MIVKWQFQDQLDFHGVVFVRSLSEYIHCFLYACAVRSLHPNGSLLHGPNFGAQICLGDPHDLFGGRAIVFQAIFLPANIITKIQVIIYRFVAISTGHFVVWSRLTNSFVPLRDQRVFPAIPPPLCSCPGIYIGCVSTCPLYIFMPYAVASLQGVSSVFLFANRFTSENTGAHAVC